MSWRNVLICGVVASAAAVGCKVTVNEGPIDGGFFEDSGSGGSSSGGSGGSSTGGSGGKGGGGAGGGTAGSSSGGSGGMSVKDAGPDAPISCNPEQDTQACPKCVDTKCCQEWLDCVADADCEMQVGSKPPEFDCVQDCLLNIDSGIKTLAECASLCKHDTVGLSSATNNIIACMRDMAAGSTQQNCTNECFRRDLP